MVQHPLLGGAVRAAGRRRPAGLLDDRGRPVEPDLLAGRRPDLGAGAGPERPVCPVQDRAADVERLPVVGDGGNGAGAGDDRRKPDVRGRRVARADR